MEELVSVIIPVYNVEKYLSECLDSVINQTYQNLEILLIDDGSKDKSPLICDEYAKKDARIKVIHKENGGVSSARNLGLDIANGEYITFIDSDDLVSKNYVEKLYINLKENNSDLSFCKFSYLIDGVIKERKEDFPRESINTKQQASKFNLINRLTGYNAKALSRGVWRVFFKADLIKNIKFNVNLKIGEDMVFLLKSVCLSQKISFVDDYLYFYRVNENSVMQSYKKNYLLNELILIEELVRISELIGFAKNNFSILFAVECYTYFTNEIKYRKQHKETYRKNIKEIKKSELYKYFKLKYAFNVNFTIKYMFVWFLIKLKLV